MSHTGCETVNLWAMGHFILAKFRALPPFDCSRISLIIKDAPTSVVAAGTLPFDVALQDWLVQIGIPTETEWIEGGTGTELREQVEAIKRRYRNDWTALDNVQRSQ